MKLTNYRRQDIERAADLKKMAMHQIKALELCNWTDDMEEAVFRAETLLEMFKQVRVMQHMKRADSSTHVLAEKLIAQGINEQAMIFTHKKAD